MSERSDKTTAKQSVSLGENTPTFWVTVAAAGIPTVWLILGAALATGTWVVGGRPGGWPSVPALWNVGWRMAADGARLDEAWLLVSQTDAVAAAAWLWLLAFAYTAMLAFGASALYRWQEAGWPTSALAGLFQFGGGLPKQFRHRSWPLPPPYSPQVPGPGVLLGQDRRSHVVSAAGRPVLVLGPTGSGKTRHVIAPNAGHWPGPVVATSVKTDLAEWTLAHRAEKGTCYGYDPTGRMWDWMRQHGIIPVVWDPVRMLAEVPASGRREAATMLAQFLTSQSSSHDAGAQGIWATLAQQYLSEVLVVAAEMGDTEPPDNGQQSGGVGLSTALSWMMDIKGMSKDPMLKAANLGPEGQRSMRRLKTLAGKDDRFQGSVEITAKEVTGSLEFTAEAGEGPDPAPLVPADLTTSDAADTLYLIADHTSQTTHKPVFAAVSRWLFHVTESHQPDPDKRPPPPLFALDELANLARLADLPQVLSTVRTRAQVICGIQERSQLEAGWGPAGARTLTGNCPVKMQLPGSSDASALRDWAMLAGTDDDDDSDADQPASWRTIQQGHARVIADEHPAFTIKMADPDRWLADTVPTAQDPPGPGSDDTPERPPPADRPYTGGGNAPDDRPPATMFDPPPPDPMEDEVAAYVAAGNEAAALAASHHEPPTDDTARDETAPHPPPPDPVEPATTAPPTPPRAAPVVAAPVSAGNTGHVVAAAQPVPAAELNGQPATERLWVPPPVWSPESDYTAGLAEAGEPAEDGADGEALKVYYGDDGKKYAVHPFGHTYGLDDAGEI
ncbi:MAG: type IV secretory system conjugative DNA transfer family protein [Acidimicrobiia bacterium]|nr:type IV secretory system conjugative DNA transfer family protein [Acidimicrobiia bacterium]